MVNVLKGDIERAIGFKEVEVNGIKIDLSSTTWKDIVDFQMIPIKAVKDLENPSSQELEKLNNDMINWFFNYFKSRDESLDDNKLRLFIVKNLNELRKEFTIGFGLKTREEFEREEEKFKEKLKKKEEII